MSADREPRVTATMDSVVEALRKTRGQWMLASEIDHPRCSIQSLSNALRHAAQHGRIGRARYDSSRSLWRLL